MARLDADELEELELRALRLQALLADGTRVSRLIELAARHRVFAAVVEATGRDLGILGRTTSQEIYGDGRTRKPWTL